MFIRRLDEVEKTPFFVDWGNGTSHRLLTVGDNMGFTICHTIVRPHTESLLEYTNFLEACYCIGGSAEIEDMDNNIHTIKPGDMYALDKHDKHYLRTKEEECVLVSVFNPALKGTEKHDINNPNGSGY